jgi:hypothetical protein
MPAMSIQPLTKGIISPYIVLNTFLCINLQIYIYIYIYSNYVCVPLFFPLIPYHMTEDVLTLCHCTKYC